ncbi:beta-N-acetylhexosaminidase [Bacteroides ovatus]|nr:beta-N-acetylhexosaminidase [Bacteroides ovatus]UVO71524.1 beta-N-acetylhexosaminidase [Bacteroides ovatus]
MRQILLLLCFLPLVLHGQAKITPILPLPDHVEYQEGTFLFPKELRVYAEQATATFQYMKAELEKRFDIRVLQIRQQEKADCILLNTHRNSQSEAYILTIKSSYIKMQADTETGLFYALQSLIQLMDGTRERPMRLAVQCIEDMPRFSWRSFMLDEARFFKGEEEVCRLLDVMAQLKMNVFHWHLTDDQGWRIEIKKYPLLTKIGSKRRDSQSGGFNSEIYIGEPHEGFYTQEQIKRILAYAKERHIKVVPEIEMPGHASAAIASYPRLGSSDEKIEVPVRFGKLYSVYNVIDPQVQTFLKEVVSEVLDLFQCDVIHVGGDEVRFNQWEANPMMVSYKKEKGFTSFMDIQIEFTNFMSRFIQEHGCSMMGWNEILGKNLHKDDHIAFADPSQKIASNVVVQFWKGELDEMRKAAENGYRLVNSFHAYTYLDYSYEDIPLHKAYEFDPIPKGLPQKYEKNIIGIGVQMWGEFIPTVERMNEQLYPRIAALAEVAWSNRKSDYDHFLSRLIGVKERWRSLGIQIKD